MDLSNKKPMTDCFAIVFVALTTVSIALWSPSIAGSQSQEVTPFEGAKTKNSHQSVEGKDRAQVNQTETQEETTQSAKGMKINPREQLYVYQLNWVRHDPARYQKRFKIPVDLSSVIPRPPLAINYKLMKSAKFRANEMAENNYFAHQSPITRKWPNEIARSFGYSLPKKFGDKQNAIESIDGGTWIRNSSDSIAHLIIDKGHEKNPGHRRHLLGMTDFYSKCKEIGVGFSANKRASLKNYWTIHATWSETESVFLTGVVFNDKNRDGAFDQNEGIPNVPIQINDRVASITNSAGGWVSQIESGTHVVKISAQQSLPNIEATVGVAKDNIQVDFLSNGKVYVNFVAVEQKTEK